MRKRLRVCLSFVAAMLLCIAMSLCIAACAEDPKNPPVKVSDGTSAELSVGETETFAVADYITANGNPVTAESSDDAVATVAVAENILTITAVAAGEADVSLICGEVIVMFDVTVTSAAEPMEPVKVKDGVNFELAIGEDRVFTISEYITANGNEVTASSSDPDKVSAAVAEDALTITAGAEGEATVTLSCADISVMFQVTVYRTYTVSVDGVETQVRSGAEFTLPQASIPEDQNFEFVAWLVGGERKQPGDKITVDSALIITSVTQRKAPVKVKDGEAVEIAFGGSAQRNVADYITAYGNEVTASSSQEGVAAAAVSDGVLTITAVTSGETTVTLTCGSVEVTFDVTVLLPQVGAPVFENGAIAIDLFEGDSGSYTFKATAPEGVEYSYEYTLAEVDANAFIQEGVLTYTASQTEQKKLTVNVKAIATVSGVCIEKEVSFTVTVSVTDTTPQVLQSEIVVGQVIDLYEGEYVVDLAANIQDPAGHVVSYTVNEEPIEGTQYAVTGSYTDVTQTVVFTVVGVVDGERDVTYTYTVSVIDSTAYRMPNGDLEDGSGWEEMTGSFSNSDTYWEDYAANNDGYYYVGVDGATETLSGTETVTSPTFVVGGSGWITFKLGSMKPNGADGLRNIYLEVVETAAEGEDTVLARVRNVLFADPAAALKLNDYKLDLSQFKGKTVFVRAVDNEDGGDFRSLYLDSFVTWYTAEPADTYTDLSKAYYLDTAAAFDLAQTNTATVVPVQLSEGLLNKEYTYAAEIEEDGLTAKGLTLTATKRGNYTVTYTVSDGEEQIGSFSVTVTVTNTTPLPEFKNETHDYAYGSWQSGTAVSVQLPADGERFGYSYSVSEGGASIEGKTLSYTPSAAGAVQITITVTLTDKNYTVADLPTLSFTVTLNFADSEIAFADGDSISVAFDVNDAEITDKTEYTLDFAQYLVIPEDKTVSYAVKMNEEDITLNGSSYTLVFADLGLGESEKQFVFAVTATSDEKVLEYTVTLSIKDTYQYRLYNGGFDLDLDGWTLDGMLDGAENDAALGGISTEETYWAQNIPFNNDGKFFSGLAVDAAERAVGTLTSSVFTVGGSGWITYKLGGARNIEQVYMQIVSSDSSKTVTLPNFDWSDAADSVTVRGCTLVSYKANLIEYGFALGEKVYIRITDNGTGDYGLFFLDSVVTYYPVGSEPDDTFRLVSKYRILNGGFETGNLTGWTMEGDIGVVSADKTYWNNAGNTYEQDGTYLLTWWSWNSQANEGQGAEVSREGNTGTLKSSVFTLKADAIVSFLFGGGVGNTEIYLEFVDADTDEVIAVFRNDQGSAPEGRLVKYYYQFNELSEDTECYIRVTDNATSNWGCFTLDGVEVNRTSIPEEFHAAVNQISVTEE